jgi:hypothetical protein
MEDQPVVIAAGFLRAPAGADRARRAIALVAFCAAVASGESIAALSAEESKALANPATASAMAIQLGAQGRADLLESPGAHRNAKLIDAWRKGLANSGVARGLAPEKEILAIENAVLGAASKAAGDERVTESLAAVFDVVPYRTRPAFDWLRSRITSIPWPSDLRYITLANTANPAHAELLFGMRSSFPAPARPAFLAALGRLKYKPALPFLEELLLGPPEGFLTTGQVAQAILAIDERFPPPALLARMRLSRSPEATDSERDQAAGLVGVLVDHRSGTPLDYKALRAALPETVPASVQGQLVRLIRKTNSADGYADLVEIAATGGPGAENAGLALADVPDPDLWRRGVAALRKGQAKAPDNRGLAHAITQLENRLARPEESVALVKSVTARNELSASVGAIYQRIDAIIAKPSVAPGDAEEIASLLAKWNDLIVEGTAEARARAAQLRTWRYKSAQWLRLVAGRPREAVPRLDALAREGMLEAAIAAADTVQFDLDRPKEALARFEAILPEWSGDKRMPYALYNLYIEEKWLREWLSAEMAYLRTGRRFAGTVARLNAERAAQVVLLLDFELPESWRGFRGAPEAATLARAATALRTARPTRFALGRLAGALLQPATGDLSAVMLRHDPAGFLSGHFAAAILVDQEATRIPGTSRLGNSRNTGSPDEKRASAGATARGLTKATGMSFALAPDPAFASPEAAWRRFVDALRKGDLDRAMSCYSEGAMGNKWVPNLRESPVYAIQALVGNSDSIKRVKGSDVYAEYVITGRDGKESPVNFRLDHGEWRIARLGSGGER